MTSIIIFAAHHIDANPLGLVRYDLISTHQFSLCIRQEPQNRLLESKRDPSIDHIRLVQPRSKNRRGLSRRQRESPLISVAHQSDLGCQINQTLIRKRFDMQCQGLRHDPRVCDNITQTLPMGFKEFIPTLGRQIQANTVHPSLLLGRLQLREFRKQALLTGR